MVGTRADFAGYSVSNEAVAMPASGAGVRVLVTHDLTDPAHPQAPGHFLKSALSRRLEEGEAAVVAASPDLEGAAARYDAIVLGAQRFGAAQLPEPDRLTLRVVVRHGAGFDNVDLEAMTRAGVMVANTPRAVQTPVALMAVTFILALAHKLLLKDRLTREGRWSERGMHIGPGVTGLVAGIVGTGGVGLETARLCEAIGLKVVFALSPRNEHMERQGFSLLPLTEMLGCADFVVLACRLNDETRNLMNASRLRRMKSGAFLINVARGAIVDEPALIEALRTGVLAGAGLDVFGQEPVDPANPLLEMSNVVVAPHHLCVTEETLRAIADEVADALAAVASGRAPVNLVNPEVIKHPRVRTWLARGRGVGTG